MPVFVVGPVVALARSAPVSDELAGGVVLEHVRRGKAALADRRVRVRADLCARGEAVGEVHDPDVIARVDREPDRRPEDPPLGIGFGHIGSTSNFGACCARAPAGGVAFCACSLLPLGRAECA